MCVTHQRTAQHTAMASVAYESAGHILEGMLAPTPGAGKLLAWLHCCNY